MRIKAAIFSFILFPVLLTGCYRQLAVDIHGSRVAKEPNDVLCLRYLAGSRNASNIAREEEIRSRGVKCGEHVTVDQVRQERRLLDAEEAAERAERAASEAKRKASRAEFKARQAEQSAREAERKSKCRLGSSLYCY